MTAITRDLRLERGSALRVIKTCARFTKENPDLVIGAGIAALMLIVCFAYPTPYNPREVNPSWILLHPSSHHLFGTDSNGSDVFSRVLAGGRTDLPLAIGGGVVAGLIGVPLGLLASGGGKGSELILRTLDVVQSFPLLVVALVVVALAGNHLQNVIFAIAFVNAPQFIRLIRNSALHLRASRFVEAAIASGASKGRVTFRHILPNMSGIILAQTSLAIGTGVLVVAALSFLGLGVAPGTPSWGAMIRLGYQDIVTGQWWTSLFPGLAIVIFVVAMNTAAEGLERLLGGLD